MRIKYILFIFILVLTISLISAYSVNIPVPVFSSYSSSNSSNSNDSIHWDGHSYTYGAVSSIETDPSFNSWLGTNPFNNVCYANGTNCQGIWIGTAQSDLDMNGFNIVNATTINDALGDYLDNGYIYAIYEVYDGANDFMSNGEIRAENNFSVDHLGNDVMVIDSNSNGYFSNITASNICYSNGTGCPISSGGMNYTNIALTNKSNNFQGNILTNVSILGLSGGSSTSDAVSFTGSGYITVSPFNNQPTGSNSRTLSVWINPSSGISGANVIAMYGTDSYSPYGDGCYVTSAYKIECEFDSSAGAVISNAVLSPNTWYFITHTYNGSTNSIYINGTLDNSTVYSSANTQNGNLYIGEWSTGGSRFHGSIDEVQIYNRSLKSTEISQLYNSGAGYYGAVNSSGLVAGYHLDEGSGTSATDFSGNSNTGSFAGSGNTWVAGIVQAPSSNNSITNITYNGSTLLCNGLPCFISSSGMNYTNLALTNQTNTFVGNQNFTGDFYSHDKSFYFNTTSNLTTMQDINATNTINTQTNFSVNNKQGLTYNIQVVTTTYPLGCWENFTGGILTSTTC